jgi:hypothetical protein
MIQLAIGLTGAWFATAALPTPIVGNTSNDPRMLTS